MIEERPNAIKSIIDKFVSFLLRKATPRLGPVKGHRKEQKAAPRLGPVKGQRKEWMEWMGGVTQIQPMNNDLITTSDIKELRQRLDDIIITMEQDKREIDDLQTKTRTSLDAIEVQ